jgi:hypothetical protein
MAIYLLHVKPISRAKGGRITRSAAYRAGERIRDERTREAYDFSDRDDVVHKEILLPSFSGPARDLDWARDRSTLWNAAERTDRRNALLGREVLVLLPPEVTPEQRTLLVRRFSQDLADRYGCAVDATIHLPRPWADYRQHHAHLLMTSQRVTAEGLGRRTSLSMSGFERHQAGLGPVKQDFMWVRERWAIVTNELLKELGFESRIDHRGARARGLDYEPIPMIPIKVLYLERNTGKPSVAGDDIRRRYAERVEARRRGPEELARVLQRQKEEGRRKVLERARRLEATPKKLAWAAHTKDELAHRRRDYYQMNKESLKEKRRAAYQSNPEPARQYKREMRARERAKLSPEQRSVQRWLKWREQQKQLASQSLGRRGRESPALTAEDSVKQWLAYRAAQQEKAAAVTELEKAPSRRARQNQLDRDDRDDRHVRQRRIARSHDYGPEF